MDENELTFDEVHFPSSGEPSPQHHNTTPRASDSFSQSPMLPAGPAPTTTATPVFTPSVKKPAWNYAETLKEAFPNAKFSSTAVEADQMKALTEWIRLLGCESPDEDYRLAVLVRDRPGYVRDEKHADEYLMSGALPDGDGGKENAPPGDGEDEGKRVQKERAKSEPEVPGEDPDDDDEYDSDEHDEMPHGTSIGGGWV